MRRAIETLRFIAEKSPSARAQAIEAIGAIYHTLELLYSDPDAHLTPADRHAIVGADPTYEPKFPDLNAYDVMRAYDREAGRVPRSNHALDRFVKSLVAADEYEAWKARLARGHGATVTMARVLWGLPVFC